ncbi:MAG: HEAT repeat domain-containing protein [Armatimonadetes bacterium]|nr:HEAT repeat domain-containing protein [Armatimonadota bacterium]
MRAMQRIVLAVVVVWAVSASAHLCNNIYRTPDRIIVKPEQQVVTLDKEDTFRVFVQNNYHTYVHKLILTASVDTEGVNCTVEPKQFDQLKAGERVSFQVKVAAGAAVPKGNHPVKFRVSAQEVGFLPAKEATNDELADALSYGNYCGPVMSAETLGKRKDQRGVDKLKGWISQGPGDYNCRAIRALGKVGDAMGKETTASTIEFLRGRLTVNDGFYRGNVLLALGLLKDKKETFEPYLNHRDDFVRYCALSALVLAGDKSTAAVEAIRPGLTHDDKYVKIATGWALAAILKDKPAIAVLDEVFKTNDAQARTMAGDAMVDIANRTYGT